MVLGKRLSQRKLRMPPQTGSCELWRWISDPQANLSQALLSPEKYVKHRRDKKPPIVQIFEQYLPPTEGAGSPDPTDIHSVILKKAGYWPHPGLIVSRPELSHTPKNPTRKERRLAKALSKASGDYDLFLVDCAPTESILTEARISREPLRTGPSKTRVLGHHWSASSRALYTPIQI